MMGGCSFCIPVIPSAERLAAKPGGGLLARLFRRPVGADESHDETFHDVSDPGLRKPLFDDFKRFIDGRIAQPWEATVRIRDYLFGLQHRVYIRGQRSTPEVPMIYTVQMAFSGCAGMAEVASSVACHWADLYYKSHRTRVFEEILNRFGLSDPHDPAIEREYYDSQAFFLPTPDYGYAEFFTDEHRDALGKEYDLHPDLKRFGLDNSYTEFDESGTERFLEWLETHGVETMRDNRCRCQLCMPAFHLDAFYSAYSP